MQRALVTGATGFLGGHLVQRLARDNVPVRALARRPGRDKYIRDLPGVEIVRGDVTDAERMRKLAEGCDVIFHAAAATSGPIDIQWRVSVAGTRHVAEAAVNAGARLVHVSTISVYGYRYRQDITEDTPFDPGADPYPTTKAQAEQVVRSMDGLAYSIVRPGMIYGPRSTLWTRTLFGIARRKPTVFVGQGQGAAQPIYVDDVVDLMLVLATHPAAIGEAFHCTPDPAPTWRDFLGAYSSLAGHERWLGIPPGLLRPLAMMAGWLAPKHSPLKDSPDLLDFLTHYKTYHMDKAQDLLGWQPQVTLAGGVARCVPYLREKGLLA